MCQGRQSGQWFRRLSGSCTGPALSRRASGWVKPRSGGGDPVVGLALSLAGLPLLVALTWTARAVLSSFGLALPPTAVKLCVILLATACAWSAVAPVRKLSTAIRSAQHQSRALRLLPGPRYGILGILPLLRIRKDLHRQVTEWAEQYGPIFKIRCLNFNVSINVML